MLLAALFLIGELVRLRGESLQAAHMSATAADSVIAEKASSDLIVPFPSIRDASA
jgi:hypothetical protein